MLKWGSFGEKFKFNYEGFGRFVAAFEKTFLFHVNDARCKSNML